MFVGLIPRHGIAFAAIWRFPDAFDRCWRADATAVSTYNCEPTGRANARCAKQSRPQQDKLDCYVASAPRNGEIYSKSDISAALPPAAAVLTVTVCSVAKRGR